MRAEIIRKKMQKTVLKQGVQISAVPTIFCSPDSVNKQCLMDFYGVMIVLG